MSRSNYSEDGDNWTIIRWRGAVHSAISGKRGQRLLADLVVALDKMPVRELVSDELVCAEGCCALGAVAIERRLDVANLDPEDADAVAKAFDISPALAREVVYLNDENGPNDTERYWYMKRWALCWLKDSARHG